MDVSDTTLVAMDGLQDDPHCLQTLIFKWASHEVVPKLLVGNHNLVVWANVVAQSDLSRGRGLGISDGVLVATDPDQQLALAEFLDGCGEGMNTFCLHVEDGHVLIRAYGLGHSCATQIVGISYNHSGLACPAHYPGIELAFALTPAEHRVLLQMANGSTADEIARRSGISVETVRSQIRGLYAKLAVNSREALFSRIQSFRL